MSSGERRVCLLTGAGGLLGDAFCRRLYGAYDIVAVHRDRVPSVPSQHEWFVDPFAPEAAVPENDSRVYLIKADLDQPGEPERVVDLALAKFGRVDLLVNNAVYVRHHHNGLFDGDAALDDFAPTFLMNVSVPLRLSVRLAQRSWLHTGSENRARNRNIVNVSSIAGTNVYPGGQALYGASKAALDHLTRHIAAEFAEFGVRANSIAPNAFPGIVPTDRVLRTIVELDRGDANGEVVLLDYETEDEPADRDPLPA
ncbi:SDR family oxidoreductase [Nocardia sp. NPDC050712]|uniref:SDR family NAD(P)-dependent oxidoreductase n=1 Tax=Nocardia sp. NPDC050712 TaxID=3155518 RepID=UPI003408E076